MDSNGSGEVGQQEQGEDKKGGLEGEEQWQLHEELMGAFEGALDVSGKRGDLRGIRVLKNDKVMGANSDSACFGNCEDDEGAEWVSFRLSENNISVSFPRKLIFISVVLSKRSTHYKVYIYCSGFPDHIPGKANAKAQGRG